MLIAQLLERVRCQIERLIPTRRPEYAGPVSAVAIQGLQQRRILGHTLTANQRHRQALRTVHIVEAEAALDAEPLRVGGTLASEHANDFVVFDLVAQQATDAAKRAN